MSEKQLTEMIFSALLNLEYFELAQYTRRQLARRIAREIITNTQGT